MSARWTPARIAGLRVFGVDELARESNATTPADERHAATVDWQTARWLVREGYARRCFARSAWSTWYELTDEGVAALAALGAETVQLVFGGAS
ncbi:MAG: hypothetical protein M0Z33_02110 [Actinomycetota bacterium]|nr:hypothetical protein [Actinomycetota bacterium]